MSLNIDQVIKSKAYVGTLKKFANPKTSKYWADVKDGIVLINPETILTQLDAAKIKVQEAKKAGANVLIICEKILYKEEIEQLSTQAGIHYLNYKVPGGVLTNFETLLSRIRSMNELKNYIESEDFGKLTKKEKLVKMRQHEKLEKVYKGVKNLKRLPELVIVIDGVFMSKFVDEIENLKVENVVFASTNFNRWWNDDSFVLMNMNSYDAMDFALKYILS